VALLGEQEAIDAEAERLARLSRFWFEEEDELAERIKGAKALVKVNKRGTQQAKPAATSKSASTGGWSTVAASKPKSFASVAAGPKKGGNAFAGLAGDSDSD